VIKIKILKRVGEEGEEEGEGDMTFLDQVRQDLVKITAERGK
jgi:hypothetical protein